MRAIRIPVNIPRRGQAVLKREQKTILFFEGELCGRQIKNSRAQASTFGRAIAPSLP